MRRYIYRYSVLEWTDPAYMEGRPYNVVYETNYFLMALYFAIKHWAYPSTDAVAISRNAKE